MKRRSRWETGSNRCRVTTFARARIAAWSKSATANFTASRHGFPAPDQAKLIDAIPTVPALPAPNTVPDQEPRRPNEVMDAADTAVEARERKPRKRKVPPLSGA